MLALSDNTEALIADLQGTEISRADNMRLIFALSQFFRTRQHLWLQYKNGVLDEETWATYKLSNSGLWRLPAVRRTWGLERDNLAPDFVAEVDDMLASMEVLNPRERLEP